MRVNEQSEPKPQDNGAAPPVDSQFQPVGEHLYFYSSVREKSCLDLIKSLEDYRQRNTRSPYIAGQGSKPTLYLHINSGGGSLMDAWAVVDTLEGLRESVNLIAIGEGMIASAASLFFMACDVRYIRPRAYVLIHQLSAWAVGTYEEIKDEKHLLDMLMKNLVDFYSERSNLKKKDVRELLKHDTWFNAEECVENGIATGILKGRAIEAGQ